MRAAVPKKRKGSWKLPPAAAKAKAKCKTPVRRKKPAKSAAAVPSDADLTEPEPIDVEFTEARRTQADSEQPAHSPSVIEIPDSPVEREQVAKSSPDEGEGAAKTTEAAQESVETEARKKADEASHGVVEKELAEVANEQVAAETAKEGETEVVEKDNVKAVNGKEDGASVSPTFADRFMW